MKTIYLLLSVSILGLNAQDAYAKTFIVNSSVDNVFLMPSGDVVKRYDGPCTLRQAIEESNAPGHDSILIVFSGEILLNRSLPDIIDPAGTSIIGPGQKKLTINASAVHEPFMLRIRNSSNNTISELSIKFIESGGISIEGGYDNIFYHVTLTGRSNNKGAALVEFISSSFNNISHSFFAEGYIGIRFTCNSDNNSVTYCYSINQQHSGMTAYDSDYNYFYKDSIEKSKQSGFFLIYGANFNTIEEGSINNNGEFGINISGVGSDGIATGRNLICNNSIQGNKLGSCPSGSPQTDNRFIDNVY